MANLETLYSNDACDIFYNPELHIIQSFWKGVYVNDEPLRNILDELIKALALKQCSIIVADARNMHIIGKKDQEWILKSWYPRAVKEGFRHQGLILNKDTFSELTIKTISQEYDKEIVTTNYFSTPLDAINWVKEVQAENA